MADLRPQRIVSLQPSATVILHALGELRRLVACTRYCVDVCPQAAGLSSVSDSWTAQAGQIVAAKPDLVIAAVPYQAEAVAEILKAGIRFLGLAPRSLADIYADISTIAGIVGRLERGAELVREMRAELEKVSKTAAGLPRPRVYCEEWGNPLIHSQPWVKEMVAAAGGEFVGTPGAHTTAEAVRAADPEVMIFAWCGAGDRVPLVKVIESRAWQATSAARSHRVFCFPDEWLNTPAPTLLQGLRALAGAIHPQVAALPERVNPWSQTKSAPARRADS